MAKVFKHIDGVLPWKQIDVFEFWDLGLNPDDLPQLPYRQFPQLNQYSYTQTKSACTIVSAFICACYLYEIKPSQADMLECVTYAHDNCQYQYGKWRWADLWRRAVEKFFESKYNKKLFYSTLTWDDPAFWKLLKKWYPVGLTYWGNYSYNKDYQSDNILDGNKFWTKTYWHSTTMVYNNNKLWIEDSSAGTSYNEYELKDFPWLIQNGVYDPTFFVYTKESELPNPIDTTEMSRLVRMRNNIKVINYNCNVQLPLSTDEMYRNDLNQMIQVNIQKLTQIDEMIKKNEMWLI